MGEPAPSIRLPAAQRRVAILDAAIACFAERGFGGTTTARVGEAAGINEALLFRHFRSKQGLYEACLEHAWEVVRERVERSVAAEPVADAWLGFERGISVLLIEQPVLLRMWVRGLSETTGTPAMDSYAAQLMRGLHDLVTRLIVSSQSAGGISARHTAPDEAWSMIAMTLLAATFSGILEPGTVKRLHTTRRRWLATDAG